MPIQLYDSLERKLKPLVRLSFAEGEPRWSPATRDVGGPNSIS